jgi:transmembrane serine protease 9
MFSHRALILVACCALALVLPAAAHAVVGGKPASRAYPAMAALEDRDGLRCGASLVAPSWALTAAHCVSDIAATDLKVLLGTQVRSQRAGAELIAVTQAVTHERYGSPAADSNDVALLRLARPSAQTPIRLAGPAERDAWAPGRPATVIGWGSEAFLLGGGATDLLREVTVPIVKDSTCAGSYALTAGFDPGTMVCAGQLLGLRDACQGDSGGPLMVPDGSGGLVQMGVVSFGLGCGYPTQYGVYARVGDPALRDWVAARIVDPPTAPASAPARVPTRMTISRVRRSGRRVSFRATATRPVSGLRVRVVRVAGGRARAVAGATRKRLARRATIRVTLRRGTPRRSVLRIELRARDATGQRIAATRRVS